jgi:hypothetical protein
MNLARAGQRAASVRGPKSAARLYNDIEYELALGDPSPLLEDAGERALALLEGRFLGVRESAREIEQPPSLSRGAGEALHGMSCTPRPCRPARRPNHRVDRRARRSRSRVFSTVRANPAATVVTVAISIIVIVHFWAYIAVAVIALGALKTSRARQRCSLECFRFGVDSDCTKGRRVDRAEDCPLSINSPVCSARTSLLVSNRDSEASPSRGARRAVDR